MHASAGRGQPQQHPITTRLACAATVNDGVQVEAAFGLHLLLLMLRRAGETRVAARASRSSRTRTRSALS